MREMSRTDLLPYRAVIVDFDRTLLRTDKSISAFTAGTLLDLKRSGVRLFAATARPERAITEYCERIPFDAATTLNGARTITQDAVFDHPIRRDSAESILEQLHRAEGTVVSVEAEDGPYANTDIPIWNPTVMADLRKLPEEKIIYKILASHPAVPADGIRINLPDDTYSSVAERKLLQVMGRDATKWNGVQKMLEVFGISADRAIYFGDDNDDLEPIRRCGCGVAVSNALDCVREAADYIAKSNDEDGVAVFLAELAAAGNI
jgi:Cof subfamily protein (haloacid dehalogenase superfamily)